MRIIPHGAPQLVYLSVPQHKPLLAFFDAYYTPPVVVGFHVVGAGEECFPDVLPAVAFDSVGESAPLPVVDFHVVGEEAEPDVLPAVAFESVGEEEAEPVVAFHIVGPDDEDECQ